jgi:hypothetical protein
MAGGYRPFAGRPRGATKGKRPQISFRGKPLAFILAVMNDPAVDVATRVRAASAAAVYVHAKAAP